MIEVYAIYLWFSRSLRATAIVLYNQLKNWMLRALATDATSAALPAPTML